jgi:hypothetical protein
MSSAVIAMDDMATPETITVGNFHRLCSRPDTDPMVIKKLITQRSNLAADKLTFDITRKESTTQKDGKAKIVTTMSCKIVNALTSAIETEQPKSSIVHTLIHDTLCIYSPAWTNHDNRSVGFLALEQLLKNNDHLIERHAIALHTLEKVPCSPQELLTLLNTAINENNERFLAQIARMQPIHGLLLEIAQWPVVSNTSQGCEPLQKTKLEQLLDIYKNSSEPDKLQCNYNTRIHISQDSMGKTRIKLRCPLKDAIREGNKAQVEVWVRRVTKKNEPIRWHNQNGKPLLIYALEKAYAKDPTGTSSRWGIAKTIAEGTYYYPCNWCAYLTSLITKHKFGLVDICCSIATDYSGFEIPDGAPLVGYMLIKCDKNKERTYYTQMQENAGAKPSTFLKALLHVAECGAFIEEPLMYRNELQTPAEIAQKRKISDLYSYVDKKLDETSSDQSKNEESE